MNKKIYGLFFASLLLFSSVSRASEGAFELLQKKSDLIAEENHTNGWAYVISGGLALGFATPAYYLSNDIFAKTVYSLGQTLGVAAIGYGSYLILIDDDSNRFVRIVKQSHHLSRLQRDELAEEYLRANADRGKNLRKIRVISFSLTSALNFANGLTTSISDLKTALFFIGGVNAIAALSFALSKSEEEKALENQDAPKGKLSVDWIVGPMLGFQLKF